jgi:hypothetical protein
MLKLVIACRILNVCKRMLAFMDVVFTFPDTRIVWEECFVVVVVSVLLFIIFQLVARNVSV